MNESFETKVEKLQQIIQKSSQWVLVAHIHPDGDAVGSTLGLMHFLKEIGKKVQVILPDPAPSNLSFLSGFKDILIASGNEVNAKKAFLQADAIGFLDFNKASRCGVISEWITESQADKVMIDHHPFPDFNNVLQLSETSVSSTCELITRIILEMNMMDQLTKKAATALYTGILTDTGGFNHNSSNSQLYRIVADLLDKGIDKDNIHNEVLHQQSESRMRLMGYCLSEKLLLVKEYETAIISLSKAELDRFNFQKGDTEGFVNLPLSIKGVTLSILVMDREGETRLSFRSKGDFPANKVASDNFEGGGHLNAAGGISKLSVDDTISKIMRVLPNYKSCL